jgi:hypothetical protein
MKKLSLALSLLAVLGAASCKKDDDKGTSDSGNSWTVNGKTYSYSSVQTTGTDGKIYMLSAKDNKGALSMIFSGTPASGNYEIVDAVTKDNQVYITYSTVDTSPMYGGLAEGGTLVVSNDGTNITCKASGITVSKIPAGTMTSTGNGVLSINVTFQP